MRVFIGLGSNLANAQGDPVWQVQNAIAAFVQSPDFACVVASSLYVSAPYGVTDQPDFINAVLRADTVLPPLALLDFCQALENNAKRKRLRHWGERSLDVDVLLYGNQTLATERLIVPHQELMLRNFVLIPLLEIVPDLTVGGALLADLPAAQDWVGIRKMPKMDNAKFYNK